MRRSSEAQVYLERVRRVDMIIKNKLVERQQWRDIALGITANMGGDRVQTTGVKSRMAEAVEKCVDMESEIDDLIDQLIETKREVIQMIERLSSPIEYDLLHKRYIQFLSLQEIADQYRKEYGWVTTTHGRALKNLGDLLEKQKVCDLV